MSAGKRLPGTPEPMHQWKGVGGVTIVGDSWGNPDGPLVILQHGGGQTRHAWRGAGETLGAAGYHAVAIDARGHGDSSWAPDGIYGQDVMVEDLVKVIEQLAQSPPRAGRRVDGRRLSLVAIGEDHVDATALVLVDIAPRIEEEGAQKIQAFMGQKPDGFDSPRGGGRRHRQLPAAPQAGPATSTAWPRTSASARTGSTTGTGIRSSGPAGATSRPVRPASRRAPATSPCRRCWCGAACPTCSARRAPSGFLEMCPRSEYVNVTGAGHMVAGDRNDIFSNAVIEFLSRTVPVDGSPVQQPHPPHPHHEGPPGDINDVP